MTRRRMVLWLLALSALALLTWGRIALLDSLRDQGYFAKYVTFADRILAGEIPGDRLGDVSPGYLWLTVLLRASGLGLHAIRNLQLVMLSAGALLCALAARRLGGAMAAVVAAVLILGNRAALIIGGELEPEVLIFLVNAAAMLAVLRRRWWVAGLLIGLSATVRPVAMLTLILIAGWALLESRRALVAVVTAAAAPLALVIAVNAALTGHVFIMQPGSALFEGNNPLATGCAGVYPRLVEDLQEQSTEPDYGHVAYRLVAARATGKPVDARASNRFWSAKAMAFMSSYPRAAIRLLAWKAVLSVHHFDIYDLVTMKRKSLELARYPAIPFGVAFLLSIVAVVLYPDRRELIPVVIFALATCVALVAFNVSARQRNALLAPLAILGGAGAARMVTLARARSEKALWAFAGLMVATPLLGIDGAPMREETYNWWSQLTAAGMREEAVQARARGDRPRAISLAASASVLAIAEPPLVSDATLARAALAVAGRTRQPERLFDAAIALQKARAWREAEAILAAIEHYDPQRENRAVSSVAYYRARSALHLRAPRLTIDALLDRAGREAPGDPFVLALRSVTSDPAAAVTLDALHDPFTRDFALAAAYADLGDRRRVLLLLERLRRAVPEWRRVHPVSGATGPTFAPASGRSG